MRFPLFSLCIIASHSLTSIKTRHYGFHLKANQVDLSESAIKEMGVIERLSRAISFYSAAIPVFVSYKILEEQLKVMKLNGNKLITKEEEETKYKVLHEWGSDILTEKIKELRGFYVKTGQIISTRIDIFPVEYTSKLAVTQDALDPIPTDIIKDVVRRELLEGGDLSELFSEFDETPLGSASIAQVHRAKLLDGRIVAVKVQRPGIGAKLLGDIGNLKTFAKIIGDSLPVDYYKIFCELEKTLKFELDFFHEAQSAQKIAAAVAHTPNNTPRQAAVIVPLPLPGLVSRQVLVMEFVDGVALSKLGSEMEKRGVKAGSPESILFGRKLLTSLTEAYASMIFGSGIIHGDPHPGNIFITPTGDVALLDCGQVKQLTSARRLDLARLLVMVDEWDQLSRKIQSEERAQATSASLEAQKTVLASLSRKIAEYMVVQGISFKEGAGDECAVALALLLFGNSDAALPGGYSVQELSTESPIAQVTGFPSEFILLGRATVMIKGIARRVGVDWGLCTRWAEYAKEALELTHPKQHMPIWSVVEPLVATTEPLVSAVLRLASSNKVIRFKEVTTAFSSWLRLLKAYLTRKLVSGFVRFVPEGARRKALSYVARVLAMFVPKRKPAAAEEPLVVNSAATSSASTIVATAI